jgi:hypothetical protein
MKNIENDFLTSCNIDNNKYFKWYMKIILNRIINKPDKKEIYCEKHHIIPRCTNTNNNKIVLLTGREHFVVHLLLPKFIIDINLKKKLIFALWGLCTQHNEEQKRTIINSRTYAVIKKKFSDSISGDNHWMKDPERRRKLSEFRKGWKMSEEQKKKQSAKLMRRKLLWGDKIGAANKGKKRTEEMNKAQSERMKDLYNSGLWKNPTKGVIREKSKCKYCGELVDIANLSKWHNENSNCLQKLKHKKEREERIQRKRENIVLRRKQIEDKKERRRLRGGKREKLKNPFPIKIKKCPYCHKECKTPGYNKWHGERCNMKSN